MENALKKGLLLISSVALADDNFSETVVLVCDHGISGSYGLVLNRPFPSPEQVKQQVSYVGDQVFEGGPVQPGVLQLLHPFGKDLVPGTHEVVPGVCLGGNIEALESGFNSGTLDPGACRFFLGYSGWSSGQLAGECRAGAWMLTEADAEIVFNTPVPKIWSRAIRSQKKDNPLLTNYPENPNWN